MSPNAPVTGWTVESQMETVGLDPTGRAVEGVKVFFVTGPGVRASVFVPKDKYTPDNVRAAIADYAGRLTQVHTSKG
jgi:hypothetical protein